MATFYFVFGTLFGRKKVTILNPFRGAKPTGKLHYSQFELWLVSLNYGLFNLHYSYYNQNHSWFHLIYSCLNQTYLKTQILYKTTTKPHHIHDKI